MMITAKELVLEVLDKVRLPAIPYVLGGRSENGTDCINLVGWCVQALGGGRSDVPRGSNTAWRQSMQWRGTLAEAKAEGRLIPGALLYICDGASVDWPDGDYGHVGIYVGQPDMEVVHASASRAGVYPSTLKNGWTHVAWLSCIDYAAAVEPEVPSETAQAPKASTNARVVTTGGTLNLRSGAGLGYSKVGAAPCGALVAVLDDSRGDFWQVRYGGLVAWASTEYLRPEVTGEGNVLVGDNIAIRREDAQAWYAALAAALGTRA